MKLKALITICTLIFSSLVFAGPCTPGTAIEMSLSIQSSNSSISDFRENLNELGYKPKIKAIIEDNQIKLRAIIFTDKVESIDDLKGEINEINKSIKVIAREGEFCS